MNAMCRMLLAAMVMASSCAYGLELPEIAGEWQCVKEHVVPLVAEADGSELGRMVYRDYVRESPRGAVQVILTEGRGTGGLYVPEGVKQEKGVMPSDAEYKIVDVCGHRAILETGGIVFPALAVSLGQDEVLTAESSALDGEGLTEFAAALVRALK